MKSVNIEVKSSIEQNHSELYKQLEIINVDVLRSEEDFNSSDNKNEINNDKEYYETFQMAMKMLLFCGQCIGLTPVLGIFGKEYYKVRFTVYSWRFLHSILIATAQGTAAILSFYMLLKHSTNITTLEFVCFHGSACLTTVLFIRVAKKWPVIVRELSTSSLDEYIDSRVQFKCKAATVTLVSLAFLEHILSFIAKTTVILGCFPEKQDIYKGYSEITYPWLLELGITYYLPYGIVLQCLSIICKINNYFSDLFIICVSFYMTSLLHKINEKVIDAKEKDLPSKFWQSLRDDYTRATRLVHSFDNVISSIVFTSFATNLFFICLQLFNILANGIMSLPDLREEQCLKYYSGPLGGYEHAVYFSFSLAFILGRFLAVSLVAASVNSASLVPARALYDVPSTVYCDEIHRFIEQVHGDNVALTGLQFFYINKEMVLSIAGTIVTYELVLLQFSGEDLINDS